MNDDYYDFSGDFYDERDQFEEEYGNDCVNCGQSLDNHDDRDCAE